MNRPPEENTIKTFIEKYPGTAFFVIGIGGCIALVSAIISLSFFFDISMPGIGMVGAAWVVYWYFKIPKAPKAAIK